MNAPTRSKINYTSLILALIGCAVALDWVPPELEKPLTEVTMILGPTLIIILRSKFTGNKS